MKKLLRLLLPSAFKTWVFSLLVIGVGVLVTRAMRHSLGGQIESFFLYVSIAQLAIFPFVSLALFTHNVLCSNLNWLFVLPVRRRNILAVHAGLAVLFNGLNLLICRTVSIYCVVPGSDQVSDSHFASWVPNYHLIDLPLVIFMASMFTVLVVLPPLRDPTLSLQLQTTRSYKLRRLLKYVGFAVLGLFVLRSDFINNNSLFLGAVLILFFAWISVRSMRKALRLYPQHVRKFQRLYLALVLGPLAVASLLVWVVAPTLDDKESDNAIETSQMIFLPRISDAQLRSLLLSDASARDFGKIKNIYEARRRKSLSNDEMVLALQSRDTSREIGEVVENWDRHTFDSAAFANVATKLADVCDRGWVPSCDPAILSKLFTTERTSADLLFLLRSTSPTLKQMGLRWARYSQDPAIKNQLVAHPHDYQDFVSDYARSLQLLSSIQLGGRHLASTPALCPCDDPWRSDELLAHNRAHLGQCVRIWTALTGEVGEYISEIESRDWSNPEQFDYWQRDYVKKLRKKLSAGGFCQVPKAE